MTRPRLLRTALLAPLLAALPACGGDGILVPRAPDFAVLPSVLTLAPGDTARLSPQLDLRPAADIQFLSRGTVATVTAGGLVTALTPGSGAITALALDEGIIYTVPVTVRGVRLRLGARDAGGSALLAPGQTTTLDARVYGLRVGADSGVRWTSSDPEVATVDADGTLRTRTIGRAVLAATADADPFLRGTLVLDVSPSPRAAVLRVDGPASDVVRDTIAVAVRTVRAAFPADARVELSLGGTVVATRALDADGAVRFAVPTAERDSVGLARYPDGPRGLVVRLLAPDGTLLGRFERTLTLRNS
ncbi:MAG: Ig-like domain-containing protein [Gemmatirosa sp.]